MDKNNKKEKNANNNYNHNNDKNNYIQFLRKNVIMKNIKVNHSFSVSQ